MAGVVTDDEINEARQNPDFRQKLMVDKLDLLLEEIARLRQTQPAPNSPEARQIREGVDLAVKLADMLQKGSAQTDSARSERRPEHAGAQTAPAAGERPNRLTGPCVSARSGQ